MAHRGDDVTSRRTRSGLPAAGRSSWLRRWWLDRSVRAKGLIVVAVPLIALIGTTSASLALQYSERQERSAAVAASGLSSAAGRVLAELTQLSSAVSGGVSTRGLLVKMQNTKTIMDLLRSQVAALDAGPAAS